MDALALTHTAAAAVWQGRTRECTRRAGRTAHATSYGCEEGGHAVVVDVGPLVSLVTVLLDSSIRGGSALYSVER